MTEIIDTCQRMSEDAIDIAERLEEVDGDLEKLTPEERKAVSLLAKSVHTLMQSFDTESMENSSQGGSDSGRAFY